MAKEEPKVVVTQDQYIGSVDPTVPTEPEKIQVQVAAPSGDVTVVQTKPGAVGVGDKLKAYWHTIITVIGGVLVILNELTPVTNELGGDVQHIVTVVIILLTAVVNASKSNEVWVNKSASPPAA